MDDSNFFNFWGSDWAAFGFIVFFLLVIAGWRIFEKAGKPGWVSLIPFYNVVVLLEIIGKPWWWLLLMIFVPFGQLILGVWTINLLSKSFGKTVGFTIGLILLPLLFYPILGFGNAKYQGPAGQETFVN
jgi:hypothetical protein